MSRKYRVVIDRLPLSIIKEVYNSKGSRYTIGKYTLRSKDDRYLNFIVNGTRCAHCGLEGGFVKLESNRKR